MLTLDSKNKDKEYQYNLTTRNETFLLDDFEDFYDDKLDDFTDSLEALCDSILDVQDLHPDKKLEKFDKATAKYMNQEVYPFFDRMQHHYGNMIWNIYEESFLKLITDTRQDYINTYYNEDLQDFLIYQEEQKLLKQIEQSILKSLKATSPQKQADLIKTFEKDKQSKAKKIIANLISKGKILRGRKDVNSKGAWYLIFVK